MEIFFLGFWCLSYSVFENVFDKPGFFKHSGSVLELGNMRMFVVPVLRVFFCF